MELASAPPLGINEKIRIGVGFVLSVFGLSALALGMWGGLTRIGWWSYESTVPSLPGIHGPLVVCGFLGTFFSLERAITLKSSVGLLSPTLIAVGSILLMFEPLAIVCRIVITIGSLGFVSLCMMGLQRQMNFFNIMMALGSVFWLSSMIIWAVDWPVFNIYLWWMAFVLFTIVGQRLELAHRVKIGNQPIAPLAMALAFVLLGELLMAVGRQAGTDMQMNIDINSIQDPRLMIGMRLSGLGMIGISVWMLLYDAAWSLIGNKGMSGYISTCFILSYFWLGLTGFLSIIFAGIVSGPRYDALIHCFFVGFVMFAIFGHSPIVLISFFGFRFTKIKSFYVYVGILLFGLLLRICGDIISVRALQKWGAMANGVAISAFFVGILYWIWSEKRQLARFNEDDEILV